MYLLPETNIYKKYLKGSYEKIYSYCLLSLNNFPVLNSLIVTHQELCSFNHLDESTVKEYLASSHCLVRYLYKKPCSIMKNGGKIISISAENFIDEAVPDADLWLLEPVKREYNKFCCNICLDPMSFT